MNNLTERGLLGEALARPIFRELGWELFPADDKYSSTDLIITRQGITCHIDVKHNNGPNLLVSQDTYRKLVALDDPLYYFVWLPDEVCARVTEIPLNHPNVERRLGSPRGSNKPFYLIHPEAPFIWPLKEVFK